jgi:hypothetical protein
LPVPADAELVLPISVEAIGHPLQLPEPGKAFQGWLPLAFGSNHNNEEGDQSQLAGVDLTITSTL